MSCRCHQKGLTLLEVLIALSIFGMIGVASYQVLGTVSATQRVTQQYSTQLRRMQKATAMMDADLQQLVTRNIRIGSSKKASYLQINQDGYAIELTRAGWSNPLMLSRSTLQRVAYDIGLHPDVKNKKSRYYNDERVFLRRHYWSVLDRPSSSKRFTQTLLADVESMQVTVVSDKGLFSQWPTKTAGEEEAVVKGIEMTLKHKSLGDLTRLYRVH